MAVNIRPNIQWPDNDLLLPADWYGVRVPAGLASSYVRVPEYVDVMEMQAKLRSSGTRSYSSSNGQLATVDGLVDTDLTVTFANVAAQWRRLPDPDGRPATRGPVRFQFAGGDLVLNLRIGLYLLKYIDPNLDDDLSVQIFATIYGHELLHVLDETDVVTNWLPPRVRAEPFIDNTLAKQQPFTFGLPSQTADQVEQEFRRKIVEMTNNYVRNGLWAPEVNRREGLRDAPTEYKKVQDRVDALRAAQINRKH
jgi:hypothetical protein